MRIGRDKYKNETKDLNILEKEEYNNRNNIKKINKKIVKDEKKKIDEENYDKEFKDKIKKINDMKDFEINIYKTNYTNKQNECYENKKKLLKLT